MPSLHRRRRAGKITTGRAKTKLGDAWSVTFSLDLPFICAFVHCDRDKVGEELRNGANKQMNGRRSFLYFKKNRGALAASPLCARRRHPTSCPPSKCRFFSVSLRGKRAMSVMLNTPPVKREIRFVMERSSDSLRLANICEVVAAAAGQLHLTPSFVRVHRTLCRNVDGRCSHNPPDGHRTPLTPFL